MKIVVYAISKNEEKHVDRFMHSVKDADEVIVCDTGSTDGTVSRLRELGATVYEINVVPFRFDDARNAALAHVPRDADICVSLDLDEVLVPGWRQDIESCWKPGETTRIICILDWSLDILYECERIHGRTGFRWIKPCHEVCVYNGTENRILLSKVLIKHHPDLSKPRKSYVDLLEIAYKEDPDDPRNILYYGRELFFHSRWKDCIDVLEPALDKIPVICEKSYAAKLIGLSYLNLNEIETGFQKLELSSTIDPEQRDPIFEMALYCINKKDYASCLKYIQRAIEINERKSYYFSNPQAWSAVIYDMAAVSAYHLRDLNRAKLYGAIAVAKAPGDVRLMNNLSVYSRESSGENYFG